MTLEEKIVRDIKKHGYHKEFFNSNMFVPQPLLFQELYNLELAKIGLDKLPKLKEMVLSKVSSDVELAKVYINELRDERLRRTRSSKIKSNG